MDKPKRAKIVNEIKFHHTAYLNSLNSLYYQRVLGTRFTKLMRRLRALLRKEFGSANSINGIPSIARLMFGLHEDILRYCLPTYPFDVEKSVINSFVIEYLKYRKGSKYSGECASKGETLFNCYLDVFITLTVLKTPKAIGIRPTFLVNPLTGDTLELDVLFEDFRLGFEFQGEHHYQDPKVQKKDVIKLNECAGHQRILIPVNISQLQSETLQRLIVNSSKDYLGLHDLLVMKSLKHFKKESVSNDQLIQFCKVVQRIYLSKIFFSEALIWLDGEAGTYVQNMYLPVVQHRASSLLD